MRCCRSLVLICVDSVSLVQFAPGLSDENRELKRTGKELGKLFRLLTQEAVFETRNYAVSVNGLIGSSTSAQAFMASLA